MISSTAVQPYRMYSVHAGRSIYIDPYVTLSDYYEAWAQYHLLVNSTRMGEYGAFKE
jgi:hypothetical protein